MFSNPEGEAVGPAQTYPNPRDTGKRSGGQLELATSLHAAFGPCQNHISVTRISPYAPKSAQTQSAGIRCKLNFRHAL